MKDVIHLRVRSEYNYNSTIKIKNLIDRVKEYGMNAVAIIDRHEMHNVIEFVDIASKEGVKPIVGFETTVLNSDGTKSNITLIAKNNDGYKNLIRLSSFSFYDEETEKTKTYPHITKEQLEKNKNGLIFMLGAENGAVTSYFLENKQHEAMQELQYYKNLVTQDDLYFQIEDSEFAHQSSLNDFIIKMCTEQNIKYVATHEVRYLDKGESEIAELLQAIKEDRPSKSSVSSHQYLKTKEEMYDLFSKYPKSIENTMEIMDKCNVTLGFKDQPGFKRKVPVFKVPDDFIIPETIESHFKDKPIESKRSIGYLFHLAWKGFKKHYPKNLLDKDYYEKALDRMKYELNVIVTKGFSDYFLLIYDLVKYAKENNIPVSPGRGSAASSIVIRCLDVVTGICPIKHNLLFERFLNVERGDDPDVDLDFSAEKRIEIIRYVKEKYGKYNIAQINTFDNFGLKSGFQSIGKILGIKNRETISKFIKETSSYDELIKMVPELKKYANENEKIAFALKYAFSIQGFPKNESTHAAGLIISGTSLVNEMPVKMSKDKETSEPILKTQVTNDDGRLEKIGFPKIDVLGLNAVDVWWRTIESVEKIKGISLDALPINDEKTMKMFQDGEMLGVFQMDSEGMRKSSRDVKPTRFSDLVALLALYRPGPMENIPEYAENKRKNQVLIKDANKKILSGVDELVPILSDTFGIIVYQEQIIQIANIWAGYTYGQADLLRRAISKKKLDVLQAEGARFLKKSLEKNRDEQTTKRIYELIVKFANYGFNRAHSTIYSYFAYQMAYLKAHFPMEFMASQLTVLTNGKKKQVEQAAIYFEEAKRMGIKMYGPNVNDSYQEFVVKEDGIHFGLTMIKNVGRTAAKDIVEVREKYGRFTSFQDFLSKTEGTEVDKNAKEALVKVGAFSQFGNRKQLLEQLSTKKVNKAAETQFKFSEILGIDPDWKESLPEVEDFSLNQKLQFEDELLCMFIENPLIHYKDSVKKIWEKEKRQNRKPGKWVAGVVQKIKTKNDSMGREMAFLKIIGPKTSYELIVFSSLWVSLKNLIVPYGIYLFKGDETDRANRIIVTDSFPLPREKELSVMIPNEMESYAQEDRNMWLKGMLEIIKNHPGNTSVVLNHGQNKKQLSEKYDVAVSNDLKKELTEYIKDEKKIVIQYYECQ